MSVSERTTAQHHWSNMPKTEKFQVKEIQVNRGHFGGVFIRVVALNENGERIVGNSGNVPDAKASAAIADLVDRLRSTQSDVPAPGNLP